MKKNQTRFTEFIYNGSQKRLIILGNIYCVVQVNFNSSHVSLTGSFLR